MDATSLESAIEYLWGNFDCKPSAIYLSTPFGALCVSAYGAVLIDSDGNECEDQSDAAAAYSWVCAMMEETAI